MDGCDRQGGRDDDGGGLDRRGFLAIGAAALGTVAGWPAAGAQTLDRWNAGELVHVIPTASHDRVLLKASFRTPLASTPRLVVDGKAVDGTRTDVEGRFWRFDATALQPATTHELRIVDAGGAPLCDAWPLRTFPAPETSPERMRIVAYTCAGGCSRARSRSVPTR